MINLRSDAMFHLPDAKKVLNRDRSDSHSSFMFMLWSSCTSSITIIFYSLIPCDSAWFNAVHPPHFVADWFAHRLVAQLIISRVCRPLSTSLCAYVEDEYSSFLLDDTECHILMDTLEIWSPIVIDYVSRCVYHCRGVFNHWLLFILNSHGMIYGILFQTNRRWFEEYRHIILIQQWFVVYIIPYLPHPCILQNDDQCLATFINWSNDVNPILCIWICSDVIMVTIFSCIFKPCLLHTILYR